MPLPSKSRRLPSSQDRDYTDWIIKVDHKYHRALQAETSAYIKHVEVVHGALIRFLPREDGQDAVEIFASRSQAQTVRDLLTVSSAGLIIPGTYPASHHSGSYRSN
jgi:hypothetical protein